MRYESLLGILAAAALLSCGGNDDSLPGPVLPVDAALSCPASTMLCGDKCVSPASDAQHCGACNHACASGEVCSSGACSISCSGGTTKCFSPTGTPFCTAVQNDPSNCGACGTSCASGEVCSKGACALTCSPAEKLCGDRCVDTTTDLAHCGGCEKPCAAGEACSAGTCKPNCPSNQSTCAGTCTDLQSDSHHCGVCDKLCLPGETCSQGACVPNCPAGLNSCSGTCVDLKTSEANCGSCGHGCDAGFLCDAGTCALSCPVGATACSGVCADLSADGTNCGACGKACAQGTVCAGGQCLAACPPGTTLCGKACVNTASNPLHCGACDQACPQPTHTQATCAAGVCGTTCAGTYADCNANPADGCETDLASDEANCGGCGTKCPTWGSDWHATSVCSSMTCVKQCDPGWAACVVNGDCTYEIASDPYKCGGCGIKCDSLACFSGECARAIFVTSAAFQGDLGGLQGADDKCQAVATSNYLKGKYKAWVGTEAQPVKDRLAHSPRPYAMPNGTVVATSWNNLVIGKLLAPITHTGESSSAYPTTAWCYGDPVVGVWTGSNSGAFIPGTTKNCSDWTSTQSTGTAGLADTITAFQSDSSCKPNCDAWAHLYCVQQ